MTESKPVRKRATLWLVAGAVLAIAGCATQVPAPTAPEKPPVAKPPAAKPAPAGKTGSRMSPQDVKAITDHHNRVRAQVGVGGLKWSPALAAFAQEWAAGLAATSCSMTHRSDNKYG